MFIQQHAAPVRPWGRLLGRTLAFALTSAVLLSTPVDAQSSARRTENGVSRAQKARMSRAAAANVERPTPAKLAIGSDSVARPAAAGSAAGSAVSFASFMRAMSVAPELSNRFVRAHTMRPEQVVLVDIRNVFRLTDDQRHFESALQEHERKLAAMRSTLQGSTMLRDLLYERQLSMAQVVAIDLLPDGKGGVVYYRSE